MAISEFLAFATNAAANVMPQAQYEANPAVINGYAAGIARSRECNKTWRQGTFVSAALAHLIPDFLNEDALDNGDRPRMTDQLRRMIHAVALQVAPPEAPIDNLVYGRFNGTWTRVPSWNDISAFIPEPIDGATYGRLNGTWTRVPSWGELWGNFLPLSGGQMYGYVRLHAWPADSMHAVPMSWVEAYVAGAIAAIDLSYFLTIWGGTIYGSLGITDTLAVANALSVSNNNNVSVIHSLYAGVHLVAGADVHATGSVFVGGTQIYNNGGWVYSPNGFRAPNVHADGTVSGGYLYSSGNVAAAGTVSGNNVTGSYVHSYGDMGVGNALTAGHVRINQNQYYGLTVVEGYEPRIALQGPNAIWAIVTRNDGYFLIGLNAGGPATGRFTINPSDGYTNINGTLDVMLDLKVRYTTYFGTITANPGYASAITCLANFNANADIRVGGTVYANVLNSNPGPPSAILMPAHLSLQNGTCCWGDFSVAWSLDSKPHSDVWVANWLHAPNIDTSSDERYKRNVSDTSDYDSLTGLRGLRFYRFDRVGRGDIVDHQEHGLIAQQVEGVLPDAVTEHEEPLQSACPYGTEPDLSTRPVKSVDIITMLYHTMRAVQQLADRVDMIEKRS